MLQSVEGYWIRTDDYGDGSVQFYTFTVDAPGQNIYANIALSRYDGYFENFKHQAEATIWTASRYNPDGTQTTPGPPDYMIHNAIGFKNCASITFRLFARAASATAQINIFRA